MAHFAEPQAAEQMVLRVTQQSADEPTLLSPAEAQKALRDDQADPSLTASIWREAIRAAQNDEAPDGPWQLLLIWLILPRLTGTVHRITVRLRTSRSDLESEMVLALLERLPTVDPDVPDSIGQLTQAARSSAWRYARAGKRTFPSADIEAIVTRHGHPGAGVREEVDEHDFGDFDLEISPPSGPIGLRAGLRFTTRSEQLEGERLGVLARRMNLHDVVRQTSHTGGRRRVGTLSLRPRRSRS
ncbi:hypothetical protein ACH4GP_25740 [Streptomyces celluloflavus]|uniref:Uncharacterized protein n=1 Tax=Streptomyces celluloflavus TaxID=58344 RepID=A0ABW7RI57_9ACTN